MLWTMAAAQYLMLEEPDISNTGHPIPIEQPTNSTKRHAVLVHVCRLDKSVYCSNRAGEIWGSLLETSRNTFDLWTSGETTVSTYTNKKQTLLPLLHWLTRR